MDGDCIALLSDPRWIQKQMDACGWKQVDNEFAETVAQLEETSSKESTSGATSGSKCSRDEGMLTFLRLVRSALSESERYVVNSPEPGMLTTQLYGRLIHYSSDKNIEEFLEKLKSMAPGPWIMSRNAFPATVHHQGKC